MQHPGLLLSRGCAAALGGFRPFGALLLAATAAGGALAQSEPIRAVVIEPRATVTETVTNNYNLSATDKEADAITRLSAGLSVRARGARVQGYLDYTLSRIQYLRHGAQSQFQNNLNGSTSGDWLDGRLSLVAGATVSQGTLSAFGANTSNSSELANGNSAEVLSWHVTPSVRGQVAGVVDYSGQLSLTGTDVAKQTLGDLRGVQTVWRIGPTQASRLGWSGEAQHATQRYKTSRTTNTDRLVGGLYYTLDALDLRLSTRAGYESSDVTTLKRQSNATWGAGLVWAPSPRTRIDADFDKRFFGHSRAVRAEYRSPRTIWQLRSSRDIGNGNLQSLPGSGGTNFTLFYNQLASVEPDPVKRLAATWDLLTAKGIDKFSRAEDRFLTGAATLTDRTEFSALWRGQRDSVSVLIGRANSQRVDALATTIDLLGQASQLKTWNLVMAVTHDLTPESSLALNAALTRSKGGLSAQSSSQQSISLLWNAALGQQLSSSLGLRHTAYDLGSSSYSESALSASLNARF